MLLIARRVVDFAVDVIVVATREHRGDNRAVTDRLRVDRYPVAKVLHIKTEIVALTAALRFNRRPSREERL